MTGSGIIGLNSGPFNNNHGNTHSPVSILTPTLGPDYFFQTPTTPPIRRRRSTSRNRSYHRNGPTTYVPSSVSQYVPRSRSRTRSRVGREAPSSTRTYYRNPAGSKGQQQATSSSYVPPHHCPTPTLITPTTSRAVARRRPWTPARYSGSVRVPWKLLGAALLLMGIPALFYFTNLGSTVTTGFTVMKDMVWPEVHSSLHDDRDLEDEHWKTVVPLTSEVPIPTKRYTEVVEPNWAQIWARLEPLIRQTIDEKITGMESKFERYAQAQVDLTATAPSSTLPPSPPIETLLKAVESEVMAVLDKKLAQATNTLSADQITSMNLLRAEIIAEVSNKWAAHEKKTMAQESLSQATLAGLEAQIKAEVSQIVESSSKPVVCTTECPSPEPLPLPTVSIGCDVDEKIRLAIAKYDADKIALADLALESGGGSVVSTRCTQKSSYSGSQLLIWNIPIWYPSNSPRKAIQEGTMPGDCWSFDGVEGFLVIKLVGPSRVTGFTMEHLPKVLSPHGQIQSAPRKFQVLGHLDYNDVDNEFVFGSYEYLDNGQPLQYFPVQNQSDTYFPFVELKVLSNHGNIVFTCLYRFRVHGHLQLTQW